MVVEAKKETPSISPIAEGEYISENTRGKLLEYWDHKISNSEDMIYSDFMHRTIFTLSVEHGITLYFIKDLEKDEIIFHDGFYKKSASELAAKYTIEMDREPANSHKTFNVKLEDDHYRLYVKKLVYSNHRLLIGCAMPDRLYNQNVLDYIEKTTAAVYASDRKADQNVLDLDLGMRKDLKQRIASYAGKEGLFFARVEIESLETQLKICGDLYIKEILEEIKSHYLDQVKETACYMISQKTLLLVASKKDSGTLKPKLMQKEVKVKNLLLKCQVKIIEPEDPQITLEKVWDQIKTMD